MSKYNTAAGVLAYENGELNWDQQLELFQHLVDTGLVWSLQGQYGRTAVSLIDAGYIEARVP